MVVTIKVTGTRRSRQSLDRLRKRLPPLLLDRGLRKVAEAVERDARSTNSFRDRTGRLRRSIRTDRLRNELGYVVRAGGGSVNYAHFIEYGTRYIRARRFLRDAVARVRRRARRIILRSARRDYDNAVRRITRR